MKRIARLVGVALVLAGCEGACASVGPTAVEDQVHAAGFLKGQLHLHSGNSWDSETRPDDVARWYAAHGYDFIVFTDHNWVTTSDATPQMLTLPGVELSQSAYVCDPPPPPGMMCSLHMNALFVTPPEDPKLRFAQPDPFVRAVVFEHALQRVRKLGGVAQLNHPNFHYAADVDLVVHLASQGVTLMEIANQAVDSNNEGDLEHPSTEQLWDMALTRGARLFGTATDDAHHYGDAASALARGEFAYVGDRGFVMVRASKDAASIRGALERGDFYASTGVLLKRADSSRELIAVDVAAPQGGLVTFKVFGDAGRLLHSANGRTLRFVPSAFPSRYWRVEVRHETGKRAWTQPVWDQPVSDGP